MNTANIVIRIFRVIRKKSKEGEHALEYLSDLYASEKVGSLNMMNALITIGRINSVDNKKSAIVKASRKAKEVITQTRKVVNWTEFDTKIVNGKIEKEEYRLFISTIENTLNPQLLVNSLVDETSFSHPSLTDRILFIHRNTQD